MSSDILTPVDSFEYLLKRRQEIASKLNIPVNTPRAEISHTKANKAACLEDLIEMIAFVVSKCMREEKVIFHPDEGARFEADQSVALDVPHIFYQLISRTPKKELKPREREEFVETNQKTGEDRAGRIYGQRFICTMYRQSASIRSLQYYVEVEKLYTVYDSEIVGIIFDYGLSSKEN